MTTRAFLAALMATGLLGGCQTALPHMGEPARVSTRDDAPPGAEPGTCWGQDETPAVVETVTEQVIVQPAEILTDGTIARPAVYKTETRQNIVKPREATWFETPCEDQLTPEFNASLQRALKARGHYRGRITGKMDGRTRRAIRAYQKPQGLDSAMISLAAARQMGLVAVKTGGTDLPVADDPAAGRPAAATGETVAPTAPPAMPQPETTAETEAATEAAARAEAAAAQAAAREERNRARKAEAARREAEREAEDRRRAELDAALEAERAAKPAEPSRPLPISAETY